MTNLIDILKETDLRVGFSDLFQTLSTRERLDRNRLVVPLGSIRAATKNALFSLETMYLFSPMFRYAFKSLMACSLKYTYFSLLPFLITLTLYLLKINILYVLAIPIQTASDLDPKNNDTIAVSRSWFIL